MIHKGHRERIRKKFIEQNFDNFHDHEILEMMLFYAIPRRNTNEIAHKLLNKFGTISNVFDAPINLLKEVEGIGESVAIFIKMISSLTRIYEERKFNVCRNNLKFNNFCDKISKQFIGRSEEIVVIMLFDAKGKMIYEGVVNKGSINAVDIYSRKIIELIILYNATSVLLAHNHPSGIAVPSHADIYATRQLNRILYSMQVKLLDHIVVADNDYISMRDSGMNEVFDIEK